MEIRTHWPNGFAVTAHQPVAQAMRLVGDFFWYAERGSVKDFFTAYGLICRRVGREVSDVAPRMQEDGSLLIPISASLRLSRLDLFYAYIAPAIRNCTALDAERHWKEADAVMKGLAAAESEFMARLAADAMTEVDELTEGEVEQCLRISEIRATEAQYYDGLAHGRGW
jgi:hypothetical protein